MELKNINPYADEGYSESHREEFKPRTIDFTSLRVGKLIDGSQASTSSDERETSEIESNSTSFVQADSEEKKDEKKFENRELVETNNVSPTLSDTMANTEKKYSAKSFRIIAAVLAFVLMSLFVLSKVWATGSELQGFIVKGNRITKSDAITARVNHLVGEKMNDVSLSEIEDTLAGLQYIGRVVATKEFPSTIRIRVEERKPILFGFIGGKLKVIDASGYVVASDSRAISETRLPLLSGFKKTIRDEETGLIKLDSAESASALVLAAQLSETKYAKLMISEINIASPNKLYALSSEGNAKFVFGEQEDYSEKLENLEAFWREVIVKKGARSFEYVDLRYEGKIFAKEIR